MKNNVKQEMAAKISEYRTSKKTLAAYCFENGLSPEKMKYWMYRRKNKAEETSTTNASGSKADFISYDLTSRSSNIPSLALEIKGFTINVSAGFNKELLLEVREALSAC